MPVCEPDRSLFGWYGGLAPPGRRTFWACLGGYALDAVDVHLYAFIAPILIALWNLSNAQSGALASVTLLTSSLGGWGAGMIADRIGRVRTLQLTIGWFSVFAFLSGFAQGFDSLLAMRALQGIGFGGEWTMSAVLMAEVAAPRFRGRTLGFVQSGWAIGWGLAAALATLFQLWLAPDLAWRAIFFAGLIPAGSLFFLRRFVPESPAYLAARATARMPALAIFRREWLSLTLRGTLLAFGAHGGYYALTAWLPMLLRGERHMTILASGSYYLVQTFGALLGYWTGAYASDAIGRRPTFILFAAASILIVLIVTLAPLSGPQMIALAGPLGFAAAGIYSGLGAQFAELYPTAIRGSGQGFCYNAGRGAAAGLPVLVGWASMHLPLSQAIGIVSSIAFAFVIAAALLLPETNGRLLRNRAGI